MKLVTPVNVNPNSTLQRPSPAHLLMLYTHSSFMQLLLYAYGRSRMRVYGIWVRKADGVGGVIVGVRVGSIYCERSGMVG